MSIKPPSQKIGYTRHEFRSIFQVYSQNVYSGLFKDFSFTEVHGRYFISFREEAGKTPLITIEKGQIVPFLLQHHQGRAIQSLKSLAVRKLMLL